MLQIIARGLKNVKKGACPGDRSGLKCQVNVFNQTQKGGLQRVSRFSGMGMVEWGMGNSGMVEQWNVTVMIVWTSMEAGRTFCMLMATQDSGLSASG